MKSFLICIRSWVLTIIVVSMACVTTYWLVYPYDVITVESPIKIMNTGRMVEPGGMLVYKISYNKKMNINGIVSRKIVNTFKIDYKDTLATAPIGKDSDEILLPVPMFSMPGEHYLFWSASYKVNPLRTIVVTVESERFFVIGKDKESLGQLGDDKHEHIGEH